MKDAGHAPIVGIDRDAALLQVMSTQHWVATRRQASAIGLDRNAIGRRIRSGRLVEPVPGVLAVAGIEWTWEARLAAALLCGGRGAAVSHRAAAKLHRLNGFDRAPVEISARRPRNRFGDEIVHLSRDLGPVDVTRVGWFAVTTVARTLLDLAPMIGRRTLTRTFDDARRRDLVTTEQLRQRLAALRRKGRPGVAITESVLDVEGDAVVLGSTLERMFLELLDQWGLPRPERQVSVLRPDGTRARLDLAYLERRVAIELDGHGSHATRTERAYDSARQNDIVLDGWLVLRFTYEQVRHEPEFVVRTVRRALHL